MRMLVTVNDAYGHILPLVPAIHELAARGHAVMVATPGDTVAAIRWPDARSYPVGDLPPVPEPPARDQRAERLAWAVERSWPNVARGWSAPLLADARGFRPDVVICEPTEHAGRVVAAALGVPLIEHGWGFTLPAGSSARAAAGLDDVYTAFGATAREPDLRIEIGPLRAPAGESPTLWFRNVPWAPAAAPLPPPDRPRILLTLGTFPHPGADQRLRAPAAAPADLDAELAVVLGHPDRGSADGLPPGALIAQWVDLPAEIRSCALVIHHGGAGISGSAAAAGVPAVVLPQAGDQFRNAATLAAAGAAVVVGPAEDDFGAVFAAAYGDGGLLAGAMRLRELNDDLPPIGALVDAIDESVSQRA